MDISIIIPTLNRREILKKCLGYLFNQTYIKDKYEIIVVDDGSTDGTQGMVQSLTPPCRLKYLKQDPSKKGPAAANNLGIKAAQGKYILFVNNDIMAPPNLTQEHMRFHENSENIIVQGPAINTTNFENPFQTTKEYTGYSNIQMGYFITWNVSINRELLIKAGLFDEDFRKPSWEDIELGFRLRKLGIKQKFNRHAQGYHYRAPFSLDDLLKIKKKSIDMGHNAVLYYGKHPGFETKIATGAWWGMLLFNELRGFLAKKVIGIDRIMRLYKWLYGHKWPRTLALTLGWAGKYWYMKGVKEALGTPD